MEGGTQKRDNKKKIRGGKSIPDELVFEILSRLPVKSLLRFKSICKSWQSMISQPQFIKTHLRRSTQSPHCPRFLLKTEVSFASFVSIDLETLNHESKSLHCPWEKSDIFLHPLLSSDGLVLLSVDARHFAGTKSGKSFVLWNPSNRSHRRISCPYELPFFSLYGLCYDSTADDYRVFIVSDVVVVYSWRNDSWNIFIDNRYVLYVSEHQAVVNGAVHWVMSSRESESRVIVYFDLVEGKFKEVPPPSSWNGDGKMNLVVLGGFLCMYGDIVAKQIEVYAMKEYGNKESWTRLFVIPCGILKSINICNQNCICTAVRPLCLTKNGQILIQVGRWGVGNYDPKETAFLSFDSERGWMAVPYVETLISPGGGV